MHAQIQKFCQKGSNLQDFFLTRECKLHCKWAIIGPPAKRLVFCWCADDDPKWNAGLVFSFSGLRTSIAKKPYIFVIFQGGPDPLSPLWIRPCICWLCTLTYQGLGLVPILWAVALFDNMAVFLV